MTDLGSSTRNEAQVLAETEVQRAALGDAQREIEELQHRRRKMLVSASVAAVQEIDTAIGRAATKVHIAEAKINALEGELAGVRATKRDAQLAANLARAQQLAEEVRRLITVDYAGHAGAIAETLARLAVIETEVQVLNARLLPGTADIQIEAFCGYRATLRGTVGLPGITSDDADFWPTRPRSLTINEIYARS